MSVERSIALRFLRAKRPGSLVSLISVLAISGVGLGVAALIVVLAVLDGFETNLKNKLLGLSAHVSIYEMGGPVRDWPQVVEKIRSVPGVVSAIPLIKGQVMVASGQEASGITLVGVEPRLTEEAGFFQVLTVSPEGVENLERRPMVSPYPVFPDYSEDNWLPDDPESAPESAPEPTPEPVQEIERPILLGRDLSLGLGAGPLSSLRVVSPFGRMTPLGQRTPLTSYFKVAGTFRANYYDFDSKLAFTTLEEAAAILGLGAQEASVIELKVTDIYQADQIRQRVTDLLGPNYWGQDWMRMNLSLFSALKLEQVAMFIVLTLIILVAAFNIASTLIMMVSEKTADIAILKAMGANAAQIKRIFTLQGLVVGFVGTFGGLIVGVSVCLALKKYEFISLPPEIYLMSSLPVELRWPQVALIVLVSMIISYLATVYPAKKAAQLEPVEALRHE
ncbi:MAG: ABC transporter permease [Deltaproteobacteria bacterium]|jgi:lipoprotein-releasing system permease protein|nr:ABC transporter permease [Deltaproteobacteria bacterium]